jgi:hypothetical protein
VKQCYYKSFGIKNREMTNLKFPGKRGTEERHIERIEEGNINRINNFT